MPDKEREIQIEVPTPPPIDPKTEAPTTTEEDGPERGAEVVIGEGQGFGVFHRPGEEGKTQKDRGHRDTSDGRGYTVDYRVAK